MLQPSKLQLFQIGKETTLGAGGTANKRLKSLLLDLAYQLIEEDEESQAFKTITGSIFGKEASTFSIRGRAAYNDLNYLLASLLCTPAITTPASAVLTRRWTYLPSATAVDTCDSFVIEKGYVGDAALIRACRATGIELVFDPGKAAVALTGSMIGRKIADGQAFTASPTLITPYNVSGNQVSVYVSTSPTVWTSTQIKPLSTTWGIADRHAGVFTLDEAEPSWEQTVEVGLQPSARIVVPKSSVSNGYLANLRAADVRYLKIEANGTTIETISGSPDIVFKHRLEITMPFNFREPSRSDEQNVHCAVFNLKGIYDATFGGACKVVIDTEMTAL